MSDYRAVWRNLKAARTLREAGLEEYSDPRTSRREPFWAGVATGLVLGAVILTIMV